MFGNQMKNCSFSPLKSFCFRSNIKHSTKCFVSDENTQSSSKVLRCASYFHATLFAVINLVIKRCVSCLIFYVKVKYSCLRSYKHENVFNSVRRLPHLSRSARRGWLESMSAPYSRSYCPFTLSNVQVVLR